MSETNRIGHEAETRRRILTRVMERMELIEKLDDKDLEHTLEQAVATREDAGELRRDVFHAAANRRLAALLKLPRRGRQP